MVVEAVFAVIAEGTRRDILEALAREHKAVGQLVEELGVSQPTVSKHLRVLREAGVVTMRAQGQKRYYSINTQPLSLVSQWLEDLGAGVGAAPRAAAVPGSAFSSNGGAAGHGGVDAHGAAAGNGNGAPSGAVPAAASAAAVDVPAAAPIRPVPEAAARVAAAAAPATDKVVATAGPADGHDPSVQQQISRSVGRAANKAADLLASLPAFRRRKE